MLLHQPYDSEASKDPQDVRQQAWPAGDRIAVIAGATSAFFGALMFLHAGRTSIAFLSALRQTGQQSGNRLFESSGGSLRPFAAARLPRMGLEVTLSGAGSPS